jgi:hypothetical protein
MGVKVGQFELATVVELLALRGYKVIGVEIEAECLTIAQSTAKMQVRSGSKSLSVKLHGYSKGQRP